MGKGGLCVGLTNSSPSCAVVMKSGNLNLLEPFGPLQACNGAALLFFYCNEYSMLILLISVAVSIYFTVLQIKFKCHLGFVSSEA